MKIYPWIATFVVVGFVYAQWRGLYLPHLLTGQSSWSKSGPPGLRHK